MLAESSFDINLMTELYMYMMEILIYPSGYHTKHGRVQCWVQVTIAEDDFLNFFCLVNYENIDMQRTCKSSLKSLFVN